MKKLKKQKTRTKPQATHAPSDDVFPNVGVRVQRGKAHDASKVKFGELVDKLADALADVLDSEACPEYLSARIAELHNGVVSEFNCELSHDVRLRFADACVYAAEGNRPAD